MYQGKFDDEEDFARHIVVEVYFDEVNGLRLCQGVEAGEFQMDEGAPRMVPAF